MKKIVMKRMLSAQVIFTFILLFTFGHGLAENPLISNALKLDHKVFSDEILSHDISQSPFKELNQALDKVNIGARNSKFNGTILVGYQGKIIYQNAYGNADRANGLKHTMDTPTQIASITKTFTGTAMAWLQEKNILKLTDRVQQHLWEFPYANITIEQLLAHRSGLPDYINYSNRYWSSSKPMYNDEVLKQFATHKFALKFTPGAKFDYSNSNYAILALIIEKVSGMSYKNFMSKYIFEPLHMNNTFVFDPAETPKFVIAKSYRANFTDWKNTHQDGVYGDKGIFTTAEDLYKWDQALYSEKFISAQTRQDVFEPRRPWNQTRNYGLGWRIKTYPSGHKYAYHTGWWHGYQGILSRYMQDEFTVVILSNRFISGISDNSELIYKTASEYLPLTDLSEEIEEEIDESPEIQWLEGIEIAAAY